MTVREATKDDVDAIRRVAEESWEVDYPDILTRETAEAAVSEWYAPEQIEEEIERGRTVVLVAEREGAIVGFSHSTWNEEGEGYILRIYVHPDNRRENVGRELLEETRTELSGHGVERLSAMVLSANEPGNAFYERFGFEHVDESETTIGEETYEENRYALEL